MQKAFSYLLSLLNQTNSTLKDSLHCTPIYMYFFIGLIECDVAENRHLLFIIYYYYYYYYQVPPLGAIQGLIIALGAIAPIFGSIQGLLQGLAVYSIVATYMYISNVSKGQSAKFSQVKLNRSLLLLKIQTKVEFPTELR